MMRYIGVHTIDTGGLQMAVRRAAGAKATALQIFSAIPKYYGDKSSIRPERVQRYREALAVAGIAPSKVIVHAAYVLNTATADDLKWGRAAAGLAKELERSTALGVGGVCFHPGAATGGDRPTAVLRVARAMTQALEAVSGETKLMIENTAGAGTTVGRTAEEIGAILAAIPAAHRARAGYGLDTCHLFSAGHDIAGSPAALVRVLDEFEAAAAGEPPSFFHLNDSEGGLGSNKDRHMLIGEGKIGVEPFEWLLHDRRSAGIPLVLETPQAQPVVADEDPTPDPWDVRMIALLRELAAR
ncbi:MAG: deoxyribonuclease IV [Gemmatimonadota bacterium]|nr:deoxyribonuclease IV [Gemmatimonadota bacterium]